MIDVETLLKEHGRLASERSTFDTLNQEIAELVLPDHANFTSVDRVQGEKRAQRQYDSTAQTEAMRHAAAVYSLACPNSELWDGAEAMSPKLNERDDVKQYFDDVMDVVRSERYATGANFGEQMLDVLRLGGVLGTAPLYVDDVVGGGLRYKALPTAETYLSIDAWGNVCRLDRRFKLTASAAVKDYGDALPQAVKDAAPQDPTKKFEFLHVVTANPKIERGYLDSRGMPWVSYEIAMADKKLLRQKGYSSWPMPVYRYDVAPGEWYGRGWAAAVLPEIKMVNIARKAMIRQTQKAADPPLLAYDDGLMQYGSSGTGETPSLGSGDIHWGGLDNQGRELVKALFTGADLQKGWEMVRDAQRNIKDAALTSLFQILLDNPKYTATEYLGRMQEKGQLIGPMVGRAALTFLGQVQEREIEILNRQGKLPPMPRALARDGGRYKPAFNSPLMRLMRLNTVTAAQTWLGQVTPFLELKPELADIPEWVTLMRDSGATLGVPAKWIKDKDQLEALAQQRAKQQAAQQMVAAAPGMAGALKDVAQAGAIARS